MHEHPRLAALSGLTENAAPFSLENSDSFAPPSLRGPAQSFAATVPGGPDRYLPQNASAEESAEFPASRASVPDKPGEALRYHKEAPATFADIKMARKVMNCRCDFALRVRSHLGSGFTFLMQICAWTFLSPQGHGDERQRAG